MSLLEAIWEALLALVKGRGSNNAPPIWKKNLAVLGALGVAIAVGVLIAAALRPSCATACESTESVKLPDLEGSRSQRAKATVAAYGDALEANRDEVACAYLTERAKRLAVWLELGFEEGSGFDSNSSLPPRDSLDPNDCAESIGRVPQKTWRAIVEAEPKLNLIRGNQAQVDIQDEFGNVMFLVDTGERWEIRSPIQTGR